MSDKKNFRYGTEEREWILRWRNSIGGGIKVFFFSSENAKKFIVVEAEGMEYDHGIVGGKD